MALILHPAPSYAFATYRLRPFTDCRSRSSRSSLGNSTGVRTYGYGLRLERRRSDWNIKGERGRYQLSTRCAARRHDSTQGKERTRNPNRAHHHTHNPTQQLQKCSSPPSHPPSSSSSSPSPSSSPPSHPTTPPSNPAPSTPSSSNLQNPLLHQHQRHHPTSNTSTSAKWPPASAVRVPLPPPRNRPLPSHPRNRRQPPQQQQPQQQRRSTRRPRRR